MSTQPKKTLQLVTEVNLGIATILPEKFDHSDFSAWLRQFECCASVNKWADEDKALTLPAFLRGVAATHFHALSDAEKDSYAHLIENLKAVLCPAVSKENVSSSYANASEVSVPLNY